MPVIHSGFLLFGRLDKNFRIEMKVDFPIYHEKKMTESVELIQPVSVND